MNKKPKVVLIECVCPHYRVPVFRKLAEKVDLTFFYGKGEKKGALKNASNIEGFKHKELFTFVFKLYTRVFPIRLVWFPFLLLHIFKENPDVIISEGVTNMINTMFIFVYSKIVKSPLIIWDNGRKKGTRAKSILKEIVGPIHTLILKNATAVIGYGSICKEYFIACGVKPEKIFIAQNTIGVERCFAEIEKLINNQQKIDEIRKKYNLSNKKVILYVGALETRKRVENLIVVFNEIKKSMQNISLLIIGDGPEMGHLTNLVKRENISDCLFLGKVIDEVSKYFYISDVFVQPGWSSLALVEAMAYSKPVITVPYGGVEYGIIENNRDGIIIDRDDLVALKSAILKILGNETASKKISKLAFEKVKYFTLDNMVQGILDAIKYSVGGGGEYL
ncbi:MAG: glycosyltransferase family 4 protein [Elusimicrobiota bacterium]